MYVYAIDKITNCTQTNFYVPHEALAIDITPKINKDERTPFVIPKLWFKSLLLSAFDAKSTFSNQYCLFLYGEPFDQALEIGKLCQIAHNYGIYVYLYTNYKFNDLFSYAYMYGRKDYMKLLNHINSMFESQPNMITTESEFRYNEIDVERSMKNGTRQYMFEKDDFSSLYGVFRTSAKQKQNVIDFPT